MKADPKNIEDKQPWICTMQGCLVAKIAHLKASKDCCHTSQVETYFRTSAKEEQVGHGHT